MFDLEKNIKNNLAYFNDQKPDDGHKARFAERLASKTKINRRKYSLTTYSKIAAAIVLLITTSYLIFSTYNIAHERDNLYITQIEYSDDFSKIQDYYDDLSQTGLLQIDELAQNDEQALKVKNKAQKKMDKLDANLAMIEKEYVKNPQSEMLKEAIISNKKMKVEVVNNIVEKMDNAQRGYHAGSIYTNY